MNDFIVMFCSRSLHFRHKSPSGLLIYAMKIDGRRNYFNMPYYLLMTLEKFG